MSILMRLRRAVAGWLPEPVKRVLRRILPDRLVARRLATRSFILVMPAPPAGLGPVVRPTAEPARVRIEASSRLYVPRLLEDGGVARYEPETMAAFLAAISLGEVAEVFDVGANVGLFSVMTASTTRAHATGFEPTPALAETFRSIVRDNGLDCAVEELALGSTSGTATLYLSAKTDSSNSLQAGFRPATGTVEVDVERLDDYVRRTGRRPGVMKVDTETTEPDVLQGGRETLLAIRPWVVCEVLARITEPALTAILRPLGYHFHHLDRGHVPIESEEIMGDPTWIQRDWLFTPDPLPPAFAAHYTAWLEAILATA